MQWSTKHTSFSWDWYLVIIGNNVLNNRNIHCIFLLVPRGWIFIFVSCFSLADFSLNCLQYFWQLNQVLKNDVLFHCQLPKVAILDLITASIIALHWKQETLWPVLDQINYQTKWFGNFNNRLFLLQINIFL